MLQGNLSVRGTIENNGDEEVTKNINIMLDLMQASAENTCVKFELVNKTTNVCLWVKVLKVLIT